MFFNAQESVQQSSYIGFLKTVGSLSNLFSDSTTPYLYYRIAEKIFCRSFGATDLSRGDISVDAKKGSLGVGLKTFLAMNDKTFQKIVEMGGSKTLYENLVDREKVLKIANLRNSRIEFTKRAYGIENSIYHCVVREENRFKIYEEPMRSIDLENIRNIKIKNSSILFDDGQEEYSFLLAKNTLTKRFLTSSCSYEFDVDILKEPLDILTNCLQDIRDLNLSAERKLELVYLPLYGRNHTVYEKSGLNQWNAGGRVRDANEVYIPVPAKIHKEFPSFFPPRDQPFDLKLPSGEIMRSKICQDGGKALMSYSNKELGKWILRDVLNLKEGELLTYEKLQILGIDSVRIDKVDDLTFEINFASKGSYDLFEKESFE